MSDGIELFKSVGKTAALWNLVVFAIEMTDKTHSVTKTSEYSFSCPGEHLNSDFRKQRFRSTR